MYLNKKINNKIFITISNISKKLNYKTYIIGGFVRNLFIKNQINISDIDIVTTGNSLILAQRFSLEILTKNIYIYKRFKTAIVKYKNISIEFVSTRKEYYNIYNNKPNIKILKNIKEDQIRRDFTINTIAISLNVNDYGKVFDNFKGIEDIKNKIINTPRNPDKTFYDDPLRMLRAIRFATQLNFKISKLSIVSIKRNIKRIRIVSIERIMQEFNKILLCNTPSKGLKLMYKLGFLSIILPELVDLKETKTIDKYTYKNNLSHTFTVLDNISKYSNNLSFKWATLLHDIGKPVAMKFYSKKGWTFYYHEIIGSNMIPYIFYRLKLPIKNNVKYIQTIIKYSNLQNLLINKVNPKTIRKFISKVGKDNFKDIIILSKCDITTRNKKLKKEKIIKIYKLYKFIKKNKKFYKLYNIKLAINGNNIMEYFKIKPSKIVGIIKKVLINYIITGKINNNYKEVFNLMKKIGNKIIKKYENINL